ncbi:MAG TPA: hypothetical protein VIY68_16385 [Steroidobacteraceae bacterium]
MSELLARFGNILDSELCSPNSSDGKWLIRPDGYIVCSSTKSKDIAQYLSELSIA